MGTLAACRRTETNNSAYCYLTNDDDSRDQSYNMELAAWDIVVITDGKTTFYVGEAVSEALHECIAHIAIQILSVITSDVSVRHRTSALLCAREITDLLSS